ncbi:hypothetical protein [Rathayibacter festucae]|uniref:Uncharacterized protein n=1 Tax=Rathayibacter festucae DSM 15932 TaxID=1328866 RepID=A0A3Q9UR50_9MICO|nr:hypothetical protein [Rathayibacter festucae]AZZ51416.1 hypothetical protein C1I64_04740 [Rathayibacter festucae DSM 15932]
MTDHLAALRSSLHARIRLAAEARRTARTKPTTCPHTWETFKQTVTVENTGFAGRAWFKVKGCRRCKAKALVDYVVES